MKPSQLSELRCLTKPQNADSDGPAVAAGDDTIDTPNSTSVYRASGREQLAGPIPTPGWRIILAPLAWATLFVVVLAVPMFLFNIFAPTLFGVGEDTKLVPFVYDIQDAVLVAIFASIIGIVSLIWWRVRPSWKGFSPLQKVLYVGAMLNAQVIVVFVLSTPAVFSRDDVQLFGPTLVGESTAPDGRKAYVYDSCFFGCTRRTYIAAPHALTMKRTHDLRVTDERDADGFRKTRIEWPTDPS